MILNNVTDRRNNWIGSFVAELEDVIHFGYDNLNAGPFKTIKSYHTSLMKNLASLDKTMNSTAAKILKEDALSNISLTQKQKQTLESMLSK